MGKKINDKGFFKDDASCVAKNLLGIVVVFTKNNISTEFIVSSTEAYHKDDKRDDGKFLCYGMNKNGINKTAATEALFAEPGTWCVYGGQLLLSVDKEGQPDNVLIKTLHNSKGEVFGPDKMAKCFGLYKTKQGKPNPDCVRDKCNGQPSLSCTLIRLVDKGIGISENDIDEPVARIGTGSSKTDRYVLKKDAIHRWLDKTC